MNHARLAGFQTLERDDPRLPFNVDSREEGDVGLTGPQMPRHFIENPSFSIGVRRDDLLVLASGDGTTFAESNFGPLPAWDDRSGQPVEIQYKVPD